MKKVISTKKAPAAIGPYSQGIVVGNLLFTAGQVALIPGTGELNNNNLKDEVNQVMKNLIAVAEAAGTNLDKAVKTTIFLSDMNFFAEVNEIYASYFNEAPPARSTVAVGTLPKNVKVEIDMIIEV